MVPAMKLFGHPASTCTRKVLATAYETQTPFDFVIIDFAKGEHKQAAHLAHQPFGQLPALEDDGFGLYESRAMARYIDAKAGSPLTPSDLKGRALMEQWMSVETSNFTPHAMKFIYHSVFKREQTPDVLKAAGIGLDKAYEVLDRALAQGPYLVGKTFSIAEICFAPYIEYLALTPAAGKLVEHPRVGAWWAAVSERPAWRKAAGR
jgi:glutathione S-transferase